MIDEQELKIFTNELNHMMLEYKKCEDYLIKEAIRNDIKLIRDTIVTFYT